MDVLDPGVMLLGVIPRDMVLEDDNVAVRDGVGVDIGDDGSSIVVDGLHAEHGGSRCHERQGEAKEAPHDGES